MQIAVKVLALALALVLGLGACGKLPRMDHATPASAQR